MVRLSVTAHKIIGEKAGVQFLMKKSSHPVPRPSRGALQAVQQQGEFFWTQVDTLARAGRRGVGATI
ncbi:MAG: hypothetical protein WCO84_06155 [bacterium]